MATKSVRALLLILPLALDRPASAGEPLSVIAELPIVEREYRFEVQRLRIDGPVSLIALTESRIQVWPAGVVSEPTVSPAGGASHAFGDFDDDGLLDLAATEVDLPDVPGRVILFRGDGTGRFEETRSIPFEGHARGLAAADVDGDGRVDIVLGFQSADYDSSFLRTWVRVGSFAFAEPRTTHLVLAGAIGTGNYGIGTIYAGDLDGDRRADVVVRAGIGTVSIWRNSGEGTFVGQSGPFAATWGPLFLVDLDRNRRPDLVYPSAPRFVPSQTMVYLNDGNAGFTAVVGTPPVPGTNLLDVLDATGDGVPDVIRVDAGSLVVSPGDGRGGFGPSDPSPLPAYGPLAHASDLTALDWDADGRLDFALMTERGPVILGTRSTREDVLVVPVLVSTEGLNGARYDSDLLLTNAGAAPARVELRYVASLGGGSGFVTREISPGRQLFAPSAIRFLREAGLAISLEGPCVGTLRVTTRGASSPSSLQATSRTTSPVGAGVSAPGVPSLDALRGDSVVSWLVESERDRSNLALVNAGGAEDGPVTLRVTVISGDPTKPGERTLPDLSLPPGGFFQYGRVLDAASLPARIGWARIARVEGSAPYLAWGTVNDNGTGDGSIVPAQATPRTLCADLDVPSVVQTERYSTELVVTNLEERPTTVQILLAGAEAPAELPIAPRQVLYLPDLFEELRRHGILSVPSAGTPFAGRLTVRSECSTALSGGARVSAAAPGGRFGLFEPGDLPFDSRATSVVVPDLRQDSSTRTNLAISSPALESPFRLELYDGDNGSLVAVRDGIIVGPDQLFQLNSVLRELAPGTSRGWARVVATSTSPNRFLAYSVVMDGAEPGAGSDDGSYILGLPE